MAFIVKIHEKNGKKVVSVCDKELLGRRFESHDFIISLDPLYFGNTESEFPEELINEVNVIVHAVGKETVNKLKMLGLVDDSDLLFVDDIPVVMFYNVKNE